MPFPNPDTQFKPGNNANPGGRPRGQSITARLRALLEKGEINGQPIKDGKQVADMLAETILKHALKGDIRHIQEVLNRVEGKVPDKQEISGRDGGAIAVTSPSLERAANELDAWRNLMTERLMQATEAMATTGETSSSPSAP